MLAERAPLHLQPTFESDGANHNFSGYAWQVLAGRYILEPSQLVHTE
jgi:hypothetical protein